MVAGRMWVTEREERGDPGIPTQERVGSGGEWRLHSISEAWGHPGREPWRQLGRQVWSPGRDLDTGTRSPGGAWWQLFSSAQHIHLPLAFI